MPNIALVTFEKFTDIDLWLMWDLLNRIRVADWNVKIVGTAPTHTSQTAIPVAIQESIDFAHSADAVLFVSGPGTRDCIKNDEWLSKFHLDPEKQLIGSICSGSLILAKLGLLEGKTATTYPTAVPVLESLGVEVVEKPFVEQGNVATAGGCLAQQYLVGWVIEKLADKDWSELVLRSIQPVGEGLFFDDVERLQALYKTLPKVAAAN